MPLPPTDLRARSEEGEVDQSGRVNCRVLGAGGGGPRAFGNVSQSSEASLSHIRASAARRPE